MTINKKILKKALAAFVAGVFLFNDIAYAGDFQNLATPKGVLLPEFRERFEKGYSSVSNERFREFVRSAVKDAGGFENLEQRPDYIRKNGKRIDIKIAILPNFGKEMGVACKLFAGPDFGMPVIFADKSKYYDEDVLSIEKHDISLTASRKPEENSGTFSKSRSEVSPQGTDLRSEMKTSLKVDSKNGMPARAPYVAVPSWIAITKACVIRNMNYLYTIASAAIVLFFMVTPLVSESYAQIEQAHPYITNGLTAFLLSAVSDFAAQMFQHRQMPIRDRKISIFRRTLGYAAYNGTFYGAILIVWLSFLNCIEAITGGGLGKISKVLMQEYIYTTVYYRVYFAYITWWHRLTSLRVREAFSLRTIEDSLRPLEKKIQMIFNRDAVFYMCVIWPFIFFMLPELLSLFGMDPELEKPLTVIIANSASILWGTYLSSRTLRHEEPSEEVYPLSYSGKAEDGILKKAFRMATGPFVAMHLALSRIFINIPLGYEKKMWNFLAKMRGGRKGGGAAAAEFNKDFVRQCSAQRLISYLEKTGLYDRERLIREQLILEDPIKLAEFEEEALKAKSLPTPMLEDFKPLCKPTAEEKKRPGLTEFWPIMRELISQYGNIENIRGKRGLELGPASSLEFLKYLRAQGANIMGVGEGFGGAENEIPGLHKVSEYNDFFASCPNESLDFIYAKKALYFNDPRYAPLSLSGKLTRAELIKARYMPINRVLKAGGIIVSIYYIGEEEELFTETETESLGFETVSRYYAKIPGNSTPLIVSTMRKKENIEDGSDAKTTPGDSAAAADGVAPNGPSPEVPSTATAPAETKPESGRESGSEIASEKMGQSPPRLDYSPGTVPIFPRNDAVSASTPAEVLTAIREGVESGGLLEQALDEGVEIGLEVVKVLVDLGIMQKNETLQKTIFSFTDMMRGPNSEPGYTQNMINLVDDVMRKFKKESPEFVKEMIRAYMVDYAYGKIKAPEAAEESQTMRIWQGYGADRQQKMMRDVATKTNDRIKFENSIDKLINFATDPENMKGQAVTILPRNKLSPEQQALLDKPGVRVIYVNFEKLDLGEDELGQLEGLIGVGRSYLNDDEESFYKLYNLLVEKPESDHVLLADLKANPIYFIDRLKFILRPIKANNLNDLPRLNKHLKKLLESA
ncbi:MAG: hypothetical protein NTW09_03230, partial [Candidatus Omnitrophica bacterium]|nr:hypothetical protein [Candidatus Omnitrophota bacterium]